MLKMHPYFMSTHRCAVGRGPTVVGMKKVESFNSRKMRAIRKHLFVIRQSVMLAFRQQDNKDGSGEVVMDGFFLKISDRMVLLFVSAHHQQ